MKDKIDYIDNPEDLILSIMKRNNEIKLKNIKYLVSYFTFDFDKTIKSLVDNGDIFEVKEGQFTILGCS